MEATPNAANQVCGVVYTGASWVENKPVPTSAVGVEGVKLKAELFTSGGTPTGTTKTTTTGPIPAGKTYRDGYDTDANGRWCITGDSSMVSTVTGGGYVAISVVSSPAPITSGNPWNDGTTSSNNYKIDAAKFLNHGFGSVVPFIFDSAYGFYFTT